MWKLTFLTFMVLTKSFTYSLSMNWFKNDHSLKSQPNEERTIEKNIKLAYNLYKLFNPSKSEPEPTENLMRTKHELIPYNGLYFDDYHDNRRVTTIDRFPTLAELNKEEAMKGNDVEMQMKDVKQKDEESSFGIFDKFAKKTDLLFMAKVLLKIIIFKKIVKFIALVCLLFFIPAIKDDSGTDDKKDDSRNLDIYDRIDYRTKEILTFAIYAIEGFSLDKMVWCVAEHDAYCRFQTMFDNIDQVYTVDQIIRWWYPQSVSKVLNVIDKLRPPKLASTTQESYLELPEDQSDFPIEVSDKDFSNTVEPNEDEQTDNEIDSDSNNNEDGDL